MTYRNHRLPAASRSRITACLLVFFLMLAAVDRSAARSTQPSNGNVHEQKITATGLPGGFLTQTYAYDDLNRLGSVVEGTWSRSFGFDRYGNRWISGTTGHTLHSSTPTASTDFNTATNRLLKNSATFDNAGNLLSETFLEKVGDKRESGDKKVGDRQESGGRQESGEESGGQESGGQATTFDGTRKWEKVGDRLLLLTEWSADGK